MTLSTEILEKHFAEFVQFINTTSQENFQSFATSNYLDNHENYKYKVYEEARDSLGNKWWNPEDIGKGIIQKAVSSAIKTRANHNFRMVDNNLVDWRKKDDFSKRPKSKSLETTLFNFYKSKIKDGDAFEQLINEGLTYQFVAYLFFIKDYKRFLPISQERFDEIFELIGIPGFKTRNNASWDNYNEFCSLIKQVHNFIKTKDKNATLIDAHSFLWIIGNQMKAIPKIGSNHTPSSQQTKETVKENQQFEVLSIVSELTSFQWTEILQDKKITNDLDLSIFQALYTFQEHKAYASQIALILGTTHPPLNLEIGRYAKRIADYYDINFTARSAEKFKFWDLFFNGWDEGAKFVWQLRPELVDALNETGLTGDDQFPEELPIETTKELLEGIKRTVIVNSYERNSKARQLCVKHWKSICAVCGIDFEKVYGEIGKGFIHVHHLTPVSQIGQSYQIDPVNDLIPVCPNCHSMLHRLEPPLTIEGLKSMLNH